MASIRKSLPPALAALALASTAHAASPLDRLYERALVQALDARCDLFTQATSAALSAGVLQARNAALLQGARADQLAGVLQRARAGAARAACGSADVETAARRVRSAFQGWSATKTMTWPGRTASWRADRNRYDTPTWRLSQSARFGFDEGVLGLAGKTDTPDSLLAVGRFRDGARPYGARIVYRDTERSTRPAIGVAGGRPALPERATARVVLAEARAAAEPDLAPQRASDAIAFRFPQRVSDDLARLDPREHVVVEFLFAEGVRAVRYEIGDFAPARAFLALD